MGAEKKRRGTGGRACFFPLHCLAIAVLLYSCGLVLPAFGVTVTKQVFEDGVVQHIFAPNTPGRTRVIVETEHNRFVSAEDPDFKPFTVVITSYYRELTEEGWFYDDVQKELLGISLDFDADGKADYEESAHQKIDLDKRSFREFTTYSSAIESLEDIEFADKLDSFKTDFANQDGSWAKVKYVAAEVGDWKYSDGSVGDLRKGSRAAVDRMDHDSMILRGIKAEVSDRKKKGILLRYLRERHKAVGKMLEVTQEKADRSLVGDGAMIVVDAVSTVFGGKILMNAGKKILGGATVRSVLVPTMTREMFKKKTKEMLAYTAAADSIYIGSRWWYDGWDKTGEFWEGYKGDPTAAFKGQNLIDLGALTLISVAGGYMGQTRGWGNFVGSTALFAKGGTVAAHVTQKATTALQGGQNVPLTHGYIDYFGFFLATNTMPRAGAASKYFERKGITSFKGQFPIQMINNFVGTCMFIYLQDTLVNQYTLTDVSPLSQVDYRVALPPTTQNPQRFEEAPPIREIDIANLGIKAKNR